MVRGSMWHGWMAFGLLAAVGCVDEPRGLADEGGSSPVSVGGDTSDGGDGDTSEGGSTEAADGGGSSGDASSGTTGAPDATTTSAEGGSSDGGDGSTGEPPPMGLPDVGSLVILGDSIGDGGGQSPFYYTLLRDDLDAHYGGIQYVNHADSGSETDALLGQVSSLPNDLPGPVVVVITSGGNDMKSNLPAVILGADGPVLAQVQANIDAALGALLAPGRFGAGVEVYVFEGNVYDASDGAGDFGQNDCNFANGVPAIPSDVFFDRWNDAIREAVEARGQTAVDMHDYFYGHGYHSAPDWYASDCTHPSQIGHDELHGLFYQHITGQAAP